MAFSVTDVLEFVRENDVRFVRLAFCNLLGVQKNIAIMAEELPRAFKHGIPLDTGAVEGFLGGGEDLYLRPDPTTLAILPWRPSHGRVVRLFCGMFHADGTPCPGDGRLLLRRVAEKTAGMGYGCEVGIECEFYLFELDEAGSPTSIPQDNAGYCDFAPLDKGENVRREICLSLSDMGFSPVSSHHERGPGQNEIALKPEEVVRAADALVSFRAVTEIIAARHGLSASFEPKPLEHQDGNSVHLSLNLTRGGQSLLQTGENHCPEAESFLAGVLHHLREMTLFLNPHPDSARRFGSDIPAALTWCHRNRGLPVRIPADTGEGGRMELRSPDPCMSPYFALALLLEAGLDGIARELPLQQSPGEQDAPAFPASLKEAVTLAGESLWLRNTLPAEALEALIHIKQAECR